MFNFDCYGNKTGIMKMANFTEDGPAIENIDGSHRSGFINGKLNEYGPVTDCYGNKSWYINNDCRCIEYIDGRKEYYKNGKIHRDNGPALIYADGTLNIARRKTPPQQ